MPIGLAFVPDEGRRPIQDDRTPIMMLPVRPGGPSAPRPSGEVTYMGPCVTLGDRLAWEPVHRAPRSMGELTYMGPALRPEDFSGK